MMVAVCHDSGKDWVFQMLLKMFRRSNWDSLGIFLIILL